MGRGNIRGAPNPATFSASALVGAVFLARALPDPGLGRVGATLFLGHRRCDDGFGQSAGQPPWSLAGVQCPEGEVLLTGRCVRWGWLW